jgi:hypothetical protein
MGADLFKKRQYVKLNSITQLSSDIFEQNIQKFKFERENS